MILLQLAAVVAVLGVVVPMGLWRWHRRSRSGPDDWGAAIALFMLFCALELVALVLAVAGGIVALLA